MAAEDPSSARVLSPGQPLNPRARLLAGALLTTLTIWLVYADWLWRLDRVVYDYTLSYLFEPEPPNDIVIIAIDDISLEQLGRWPWNRRIHADLLSKLSPANASAIGMDIIFSERDTIDPGADQALADAIANAGNVVLPVYLSEPRSRELPHEGLPLPSFTQATQSLGHVEVHYDKDGLARHVDLRGGLGTAHWQNFAVAMLELGAPERTRHLPPHDPKSVQSHGHNAWVQEHRVLLPFVGPPSMVLRASYIDVLNGKVPLDVFENKFVLVGATALGLGDVVATPLQGGTVVMPGVEFQANVLHAVARGRTVNELNFWLRLALSIVPIALAMWLFPRLSPIANLALWVVLLVGMLIVSIGALLFARTWIAPAPALATILLSYPTWSWIRLEAATRYLRQELDRLHSSQDQVPTAQSPKLLPTMQFLTSILPISGWVARDRSSGERESWGEPVTTSFPAVFPDGWQRDADHVWTNFFDAGTHWQVGTRWHDNDAPSTSQLRLLDAIASLSRRPNEQKPIGNVELVALRIEQIRALREEQEAWRRIVSEGLSQMADGVLLVNVFGQVMAANPQAALYLTGNNRAQLEQLSVLSLFESVEPATEQRWEDAFRSLIVDHTSVHFDARHRDGRDLFVQMSPIRSDDARQAGFVVNLSDITTLKNSERKRAEVASFLSHDLRSPLVSVLATVELAKETAEPQKLLSALDRIQDHTRKTLSLAEQFLDAARADSREVLKFENIDLVLIGLNAIEQVWSQSQKKEIELTQNFDLVEAPMRGDAGLMERALVNLLNNAIKYSENGSTVRLVLSEEEAHYRCAVEDNGYGIATDDIPKLFNRFERLGSATLSGESGAGLGLAFVKGVIDRHGGTINVTSQQGVGSTFTIRIPKS